MTAAPRSPSAATDRSTVPGWSARDSCWARHPANRRVVHLTRDLVEEFAGRLPATVIVEEVRQVWRADGRAAGPSGLDRLARRARRRLRARLPGAPVLTVVPGRARRG